jgi:hypothetical protein
MTVGIKRPATAVAGRKNVCNSSSDRSRGAFFVQIYSPTTCIVSVAEGHFVILSEAKDLEKHGDSSLRSE